MQTSEDVIKNDNVCTLCEEYAGQALKYLNSNKTQTEILELLHQSCSQMHSYKQQERNIFASIYVFTEIL